MSKYVIKNKPEGHKKIWDVKTHKVLATFDKNNEAVVENKTIADSLKKLGYEYEVEENSDKD